MTLRRYVQASREPRYSLLFALPLLLAYEGLTLALSHSEISHVRNGADVLLKTVFVAFGGRLGVSLFALVLVGLGAWLVWRDRRRHPSPMSPGVFGGMVVESVVYAALLGAVVATLSELLLRLPLGLGLQGGMKTLSLATQLAVSLGAGVYEELLFRVLLVSGLVAAGRALGWGLRSAIMMAVVGSALIFSAFHYIGPLGDRFAVPTFTFRAVAGVVLSGLYVTRGLGITAWTHALYDVGLSLANSASA